MADELPTVAGPKAALARATEPAGSGRASRGRRIAVATALVLIALAVRSVFFKYETGDYTSYFHVWYEFILGHGRFGALKYSFANYNEPYLYLLALLTYTPLGPLVGIKLISVSFDLVLGYFSYRIVRLRYPHGWVPTVAAAAVLFLPTVVLNSALWGQIDATYTSLALGGLYFMLRRRPWLACIFFGLALSFKLQVVFPLPCAAPSAAPAVGAVAGAVDGPPGVRTDGPARARGRRLGLDPVVDLYRRDRSLPAAHPQCPQHLPVPRHRPSPRCCVTWALPSPWPSSWR